MTFTFEFTIDKPEQVRATRVMYHRRWSTRLMYAFFAVLAVLILALHAVNRYNGRQGWWPGVIIVLGAAAAGVGAGYMSPHWMVSNLRKNNRAAAGPHTYRLSEQGLHASSPGATTTIEWANVPEAFETAEFLFLYVSKGFAVLLPKRAVPAPEMPNLRQSLREWLGERANVLA